MSPECLYNCQHDLEVPLRGMEMISVSQLYFLHILLPDGWYNNSLYNNKWLLLANMLMINIVVQHVHCSQLPTYKIRFCEHYYPNYIISIIRTILIIITISLWKSWRSKWLDYQTVYSYLRHFHIISNRTKYVQILVWAHRKWTFHASEVHS
jgi:hypothetical protein